MSRELPAVTTTTSGLINNGLSGIMGLRFTWISALQTNPFWQSRIDLSKPLFSFYLEHHVNQPTQINAAPGSMLTLGGTEPDHSHRIKQDDHLVSGLAAIGTGTTLNGAPTSITASILTQVPGSSELVGDWQGLCAFRYLRSPSSGEIPQIDDEITESEGS
ncbi:hypothetical protein DEU56DRAFT_941340 [Suillus clintonianus]|uniref:uncharacterized protein n=1 Tax=Suillus clintonianus TaxID=1904413 RepID=UPI001B864C7A|nr:uncharacterized protein DEU56DRAFT_941340 [Suillus clintonianus]KAG2141094.1 hypothetical protein DEU56DRAFT_941340 [Suillus clintonianus]